MRRFWSIVTLLTLVLSALSRPALVMAQTGQLGPASPELTLSTSYPSQVIGMGESTTLTLKLHTATTPQVVRLELQEIPEGWAATFRGGGQIIQAAYVEPDEDASVTLKLEPPKEVAAGTYRFVVVARGDQTVARLPIELTIREKLPPRLSLETDLPLVQGSRSTTFRFNSTLKNDGDEDLTVNLEADAPEGFLVKFKLSAQEVTSLPLEANQSKTLSIEVRAFADVPAGDYPFPVRAWGDGVQATLPLVVRVTGQPDLKVTAPEGRLSGRAYAGRIASLTIIIQNTGSAPAHAVKLSANPPSGWSVEFDPEQVDQIPAGHQAEVTARIRPADKAVAGDYMVTVSASPEETIAGSKSDFRVTVLTSTLWGVVGVVLIALAVGVVALAVLRFGRR